MSSITNGFIILIDRGDHLNYLLQINSIFSLRNDPRINNSDVAFTHFAAYFQDLVQGVQTKEELDAFARRVDQEYLVKFYAANLIADTDYEIKTKVRALYVSLFIQKSLQIQERTSTAAGRPGELFEKKKQEMLAMLAEQPSIEGCPGIVPGTELQVTDALDIISFTRFFAVLQEAQRWQTHAKWEKFAFYVASMAVGEGIWYCPGGAAKPETLRRKHLFALMERCTNKYHKSAKKRKSMASTSLSSSSSSSSLLSVEKEGEREKPHKRSAGSRANNNKSNNNSIDSKNNVSTNMNSISVGALGGVSEMLLRAASLANTHTVAHAHTLSSLSQNALSSLAVLEPYPSTSSSALFSALHTFPPTQTQALDTLLGLHFSPLLMNNNINGNNNIPSFTNIGGGLFNNINSTNNNSNNESKSSSGDRDNSLSHAQESDIPSTRTHTSAHTGLDVLAFAVANHTGLLDNKA